MHLKLIEKDTLLDISTCDEVLYSATFHDVDSDTSFYIVNDELFEECENLRNNLNVSFTCEDIIYSFIAKTVRATKRNNLNLVLLQQCSAFSSKSRRKHPRDEIKMEARLFSLDEFELEEPLFINSQRELFFPGVCFDISQGGLGLVSNDPMDFELGMYFLIELLIGQKKDRFILPAKLVRIGDCPQTALYKYDYGLEFIFAENSNEKSRLCGSLLNAKLQTYK